MQGYRATINKEGKSVPNPKGRWVQGRLRSYENCLQNYQNWEEGVYKDEKEKQNSLKEDFFGNRYPPLRIFDSTMDGTNFIEIFVIPMLHELLGKLLVLYKVVKVFATNLTSKSGSKTILYNVDIGWLGIEVS